MEIEEVQELSREQMLEYITDYEISKLSPDDIENIIYKRENSYNDESVKKKYNEIKQLAEMENIKNELIK
jgi:predicted RND superfamily exporter protein